MDSLDPLPSPTENNPPVMGNSKLLQIESFSSKFTVMDIVGDDMVEIEEDFGVINYDTFQTDCRRNDSRVNNCIGNAGNEMQV